jgi:integron integrase
VQKTASTLHTAPPPAGGQNCPGPPTGIRRPPKLTDRLKEALRARHYSPRTEQAYVSWACRYIRFHKLRHLGEMAESEINAFLTHLALKEGVSSSTQNQALSALLFLYRHVVGRELGELGEIVRARRPVRLPIVMSRDEVSTVLTYLQGDKWLAASLMYGAGLRLMECLQLRVQDVSFASSEILVRDGKGGKDRVTMLPESLKTALQEHLKRVRAIHQQDLAEGWGRVQLPDALSRKYPGADGEWRWQWVFPPGTPVEEPEDRRARTPPY